MSRLPNAQPASRGGGPAPVPAREQASAATAKSSAAPGSAPNGSAAPPTRQPAQVPLNYGSGDEVVFSSEAEFMEDFLKDDHTVPVTVLFIAAAISFAIHGYRGFEMGGMASLVNGCLGIGITLIVGAVCASVAGWIVAKIFGDDYGSTASLILRFSAVAAAWIPIFEGIMALLGFMPAMIFSYPVMLVVTIFVAGIDLVRSIVFNVILTLVYLMVFSFFMMSLAASMA